MTTEEASTMAMDDIYERLRRGGEPIIFTPGTAIPKDSEDSSKELEAARKMVEENKWIPTPVDDEDFNKTLKSMNHDWCRHTGTPEPGDSNDPLNPDYYKSGRIECIDFIEDKRLGFHLGNAVKYICRAGKKDPSKTVEDLEKAIWYINRYIKINYGKVNDDGNKE